MKTFPVFGIVSLGDPALRSTVEQLRRSAHVRADLVAYIAGCLNLHTKEVEALLIECNANVDIVYERLQLTQYYGRCDLSTDYLFGTQEPEA